MIHVIAVITAKPGLRDTILGHFRANTAAVLAEQGCIEYGAAIDAEGAPAIQTAWGADTFLVIVPFTQVIEEAGLLVELFLAVACWATKFSACLIKSKCLKTGEMKPISRGCFSLAGALVAPQA